MSNNAAIKPGVGQQGPQGAIAPRSTAAVTTASLAAAATENGTIAIAKTFAISKVVASGPCRIRLYATAAARTADASRPATQQPLAGTQHGVILDLNLLTSGQYTLWICSPLAYGANNETSPSANISYAITNQDTASHAITVTFTFTSEES